MKVILCSWGLSTESIIRACDGQVDKPRGSINVAIINEAIKGVPGDHRWFADELQHLRDAIGGNLEFIDLQSQSLDYVQERIAESDMIYCFGGNTDYLSNVFIQTGFAKILPEVLANKVWVGSSAGSCVLCHREDEETHESVYQEQHETDCYMDIIPLVFMPHLHGWFKYGESEVIKASACTDLPVYALSDQAALVIDGDEAPKIIGDDYLIAEKGKLIN